MRPFYRILIVGSAIAFSLVCASHARAAQAATAMQTNVNSSLDDAITKQMNEAGIVGLGAAIIVNKKIVWTNAYGYADQQQGIRFTQDTVMNIGSISKTVTGIALMRTVQDGKLSLDKDINLYLPFKLTNPHFPNEVITLRHLATHTSGITDRWEAYQNTYHFGGDSPVALANFMKQYFTANGQYYSSDNFLKEKPGAYREYSNIGAGLAGYIIELATGMPLNEYTATYIFNPLGMSNTFWFLSEMGQRSHSTLYIAQDGMSVPIQRYGITTYPDGGLRTSVNDLSKFFIALLDSGQYQGKTLLDKSSIEAMLEFQFTATNKPKNVELNEKNSGIFWSTKNNVSRIGHGGSDPGLKTEMLASMDKSLGVILFTNTSLNAKEMRPYVQIFNELWVYGEELKTKSSTR